MLRNKFNVHPACFDAVESVRRRSPLEGERLAYFIMRYGVTGVVPEEEELTDLIVGPFNLMKSFIDDYRKKRESGDTNK